MLPLLLRPRLLSLKNSIIRSSGTRTQRGRQVVITAISLVLMFALYRGARDILIALASTRHSPIEIPPSLSLSLLCSLLLTMLLFSNSVSALGTLFLSHDLEMVLASPTRGMRLFTSKLAEVAFSSSWMVTVFGIPLILAYGSVYSASWQFYLLALVVGVPIVVIPSAAALAVVTIFARIVPATRTREILLLCLAGALLAIYLAFKILLGNVEGVHEPSQIAKLQAMLSLASSPWNPSSWVGSVLGVALTKDGFAALPFLFLYGVALLLSIFGYSSLCRFHYRAYSKAKSGGQTMKLPSRMGQRVFTLMTPFLSSPYRAMLAKEYKVFCRDMAQAVQLLLLIGICMIYLYNFKVLHAVDGLPEATRGWWQAFLVLSNLAMGAFVITAVSTRFVFPSVSLEGNSFWVIQSSPLAIADLLRAKFIAWFTPLCIVGCVIFGSGALAIDAEPHIVMLNMFASCFICYGIVGVAVGLGAFFKNFQWEHTSQLSASFGSLVYMLACAILIALDMVPTCTLLALRTLRNSGVEFTMVEWYLGVASSGLLLLYINVAAMRWAFSLGKNALSANR